MKTKWVTEHKQAFKGDRIMLLHSCHAFDSVGLILPVHRIDEQIDDFDGHTELLVFVETSDFPIKTLNRLDVARLNSRGLWAYRKDDYDVIVGQEVVK